jgi:Tfp pilus assembly protein PilF
MNKKVKLGIAKDPKIDVTKSKVNDIIKAIATNYSRLGDDEKALEAIKKAQEANPNDYDLIIEEANVHYRLGNDALFKAKLEEAIELNPTDPNLYFNVGVMNMNLGDNKAATYSFKKAIELKPDFGDAYNNLGAMELDKAKPVQEELDANAMNFKKYDLIKAEKLLPIYRAALVYYEKAQQLIPEDEALKNLVNSLYENLEMDKKIE